MDLTEQQFEYDKEFKLFTKNVIEKYAENNDKEERMNPELLKEMIKRKYLGAMISRDYGGLDFDSITIGLLNYEAGGGCSSVRSLLTVHGMCALGIQRWGTNEQKEYWLPKLAAGEKIGAFALTEPNVGSNAKGVETIAIEKNDYYILNGEKKWITMSQIADVFIIIAKLEDKPTAFIVEKNTEGLTVEPIKGIMSFRASMIGKIHLNNCKIPKGNLLCKEGLGISHVGLSCLDYGRYMVAWGSVGLGQACVDLSIKYAKERKQFGTYIMKNQLIQKMITEMSVDVKAAKHLCIYAGHLKQKGDPESIVETWVAKYYSSKMVNRVAGRALQVFGANGISDEYPIARYFRDAKINEIIEGSSQMNEIMIAHSMFRSN